MIFNTNTINNSSNDTNFLHKFKTVGFVLNTWPSGSGFVSNVNRQNCFVCSKSVLMGGGLLINMAATGKLKYQQIVYMKQK